MGKVFCTAIAKICADVCRVLSKLKEFSFVGSSIANSLEFEASTTGLTLGTVAAVFTSIDEIRRLLITFAPKRNVGLSVYLEKELAQIIDIENRIKVRLSGIRIQYAQ